MSFSKELVSLTGLGSIGYSNFPQQFMPLLPHHAHLSLISPSSSRSSIIPSIFVIYHHSCIWSRPACRTFVIFTIPRSCSPSLRRNGYTSKPRNILSLHRRPIFPHNWGNNHQHQYRASSIPSKSPNILKRQFSLSFPLSWPRITATNSPQDMAAEYKLKDIKSLGDIPNYEKVESEVEGIEGAKVLLVRVDDKVYAIGPKCTHYGAPLKLGVVASDRRITCPWHGACFNIGTGDVEDAPAPNALNTYEIIERDGAIYIRGEEAAIKSGQRSPNIRCSVAAPEKVVIVGGGSGAFGAIQALRELNFKGAITAISTEPNLPLDRTKLSKALIPDASKLEIRSKEWYQEASITVEHDEVTSVEFEKKTVFTKSGKSHQYSKLILSTGGIPRRLPLAGFKDLGNIFVLRTVADVQDIHVALGEEKKKKIVIVGSSFIGMEVGNCLAKENDVSIIGMEKAPLERVMGEEVGKIFQKNLEKSGVKFYMSAAVDKATPSSHDPSKVGAVHLKDGTELPADLVILGIGVRPATDYLRGNPAVTLEKDGSLRTDESFAVNGLGGDVFAVGDIATYTYHGPGADPVTGSPVRIEHWNVAQNAGRSVAKSIVHSLSSSQPIKPRRFVPVFWSALGAQLRYCGNTTAGYDSVVLKGEPENAKFAAYYCKGETILAVATMGMDPVMVKSAELIRLGAMPTKSEIEGGINILAVKVPGKIQN